MFQSHLLPTWLFNTMPHLAFTFKSLPSCWFRNPPLQHSHLHLLFPFPLFLVSFSLLVLSVLHSDFSLHCQVQLCELCYTEIYWETHTKIQTPKWNQAEPPSRSVSRFLAKQCMAILPPREWRTSGTEWHSHRHRVPLKEQMLASSWHMPLR